MAPLYDLNFEICKKFLDTKFLYYYAGPFANL